ncbi:MAG: hypothetical protein C4527_10290, partial [Candidatus Omnitrophota bacterium]
HYVPHVITQYFADGQSWTLPDYEVYLAGDRYSAEERFAAFCRLDLDTTRERMLLAMIRDNNKYMARHLDEMSRKIPLSTRIHLTGGGLSDAFIRCKKEWMGEYDYVLRENSSLMGAAELAHYHVSGEKSWLANSDRG